MVDSMIRLFPSNATDFTTNGLGYLPDATECTVTEERNGAFELEMKYPVSGKRYKDIVLRSLIVAKPNPYDDPQPFRVYEISRPMKGMVTIKAAHISYDMNGIPVGTCGAINKSPSIVFDIIKSSAISDCPFTFWTDKTNFGSFQLDTPQNMRACLGGTEGSVLDIFKGEYKFDNFLIRLYSSRGLNRGVTIRYGKNLTDLRQDESSDRLYTGVYSFWKKEIDNVETIVETEPKVVPVKGTFNYSNVMILDLSSEFEEIPTKDQLKTRVEKYISDNDIGIPKVNLDISFVNLMDSNEYELIGLLETVHLCDIVNVSFEELGVNATAKCIKTVYDCISNRYDRMELGDAKSKLTNTIADQIIPQFGKLQVDTEKKLNEQYELQQIAIDQATKLITGNLGGHVVLHSSTGGDKPDELLIMDTEDIKTAKKIWRWNLSGWGYSKTGYNGPYSLAATMDGVLVADFIQTGTMSANRIKGGVLTLGGNDNGNGRAIIYDKNGTPIIEIHSSGLDCTLGTEKVLLRRGRVEFERSGDFVGFVGTNVWNKRINSKDYQWKGISFDLDLDGDYMAWAKKMDDRPNVFTMKLFYTGDTVAWGEAIYNPGTGEYYYEHYDPDTLNAGCDLNMHWNKIYDFNWPDGSISGTLNFVQPLGVDSSDGTLTKWSNASLTFKSGILTSASWSNTPIQ